MPDDPNARRIIVLLEDNNGTVWVGTSNGLFRLIEKDNQFAFENIPLREPLAGNDGLVIVRLLEDRRGALWIGTSGSGLFRLLPDGRAKRFSRKDGLPNDSIESLLEDRDGRVWAGMRDLGGLALLRPVAEAEGSVVERIYTMKDGLPSGWITSIYQSSDGRIWIGTTGGLCLWQGGSVFKTYTAKNGLCDSETWSIFEDKDGNLWTGTRCGAKKITRFGFSTYDRSDGLGWPVVDSFFENLDGELFATVNTQGRLVSRFDGAGFTLVKPNFPKTIDYFGWGWNQTVWQDSVGDWWFPTGRGLYRFPKPERFEDLAKIAPQRIETGAKTGGEVFRIFEDSHRDIWIATAHPNELLRWERAANTWHNFTQEAALSARRVGSAFAEDKSGNLWIATSSEDATLIRYRDGIFKVFTQADGAPKGWTWDLFLDHAGRLWLANTSVGLLRLDNTNSDDLHFVKYTTAEGLSSNGSHCVTEDEFGRIYVGSGRGLDRLDPETGQVENFTTADGLPDSSVEVAYRDRNHALWFTTRNGLARFIPEPPHPRIPPTILITGVHVAGTAQPISILGETEISTIDLAFDERQVTVDFVGLGASLGEKLRYEYRLTGEEWIQTNDRSLNFANLGAGEYRLEVRALTADRIYSQTPASLSFRIAAPLWRRWWFAALVLVLAGLVIYGFYRYRLNKLLEIERTRMRIATDLHDDIGSNLSKISLLSEIVSLQSVKDKTESNRLLNSIAEISRESVSSMSDIVWAINPKRDSVLEMTRRMRSHAEEIFVEKGVRVAFNAPEDGEQIRLPMNVRRELYLIFKEAVNNVAKHADCKRFEIDFRVAGGEIYLQIGDDGNGFDLSQKSDGNGLANMRARAEASGGKFEVESEAGSGTKVKIRIPIKISSL